jgi:hypothetical protein
MSTINQLTHSLFCVPNKDKYPPFKNGLYMEEYFLKYIIDKNIITKRKYIPALWTNFQIEHWFNSYKHIMQQVLDEYIKENPSENGYFTIVQYDDGPLLQLPENTIVYGACSGNIPLPLIYQDINYTLDKIPKKNYKDKHILCSFVGSITGKGNSPTVRESMIMTLKNNKNFIIDQTSNWTSVINEQKQNNFITTTINSKFALAPRGYGRSSFRFFEILKLGTIPIYIWDDIEWLPYKDTNVINYSAFCISIHISNINLLEEILNNIDETKYNNMLIEYNKIKEWFELEGMCKYIIDSL